MHIDDIKVGDFLTITGPAVDGDRSGIGDLLEVTAIDPPFIVLNDGLIAFSVNPMEAKLQKCSDEFVKAMKDGLDF